MLALPVCAAASPARYRIDAALTPAARSITGTVEIEFENTSGAPLDELTLLLYPNRFAVAESGINDLNRPFVYPREELVPGGMGIDELAIRNAGPVGEVLHDPVRMQLEPVNGWPDTRVRVRLPAALAPGDAAVVWARFRTILPERYGPFGIAEGRLTALGGWFPILGPGARTEVWLSGTPLVSGDLWVPADYTLALGRTVAAAGHGGRITISAGQDAAPLLLASRDYRLAERNVDGTSVRLLELPLRRALAFPRRRQRSAVLLDAVERILRARPAGIGPGNGSLLVAEAPLRLELTAPASPGVAVVSDRILRVHPLLTDFHERELASAIYGALLAQPVAARESPSDAPWVLEGLAAALADGYLARVHPRHRTVYDWIGLFNVFAIVDRFESAPKIPFARAFFPEARHADELGETVEGFARTRPPGRTIFTKLRNQIGDAEYRTTVTRYLTGGERFREAATAVHGSSLDWLFAQWVAPYPSLDYALEDGALNREQSGGEKAAASSPGGDDSYEHRLGIVRHASRPIREPVEVEVRGKGNERARGVWNGEGERAEVTLETPWRARGAVLDPDRRLLEDTRVNNFLPPPLQVVLDSADVTVTSSEFGMSGLFVGRRRYDYTRDVALTGYFSDRSLGLHLGPRVHWGPPNDATSYRHNLYGFFTLETLRGDFGDDSRPARHDDGRLAGVGLRYDYTDEFAYDNPTASIKFRFFGDWFSGAVGSSFDYVDGGIRVALVRPLWSPRTLVAAQWLTGFSAPVGSDRVPNQGRFSLGGDLAVRAIPVEERLGENIALVRAELRQTVYPEVDFNLADFLVLRHGQLRLFVDAGRVEDRRSSLYRLSDFAVGVGVGAAAAYDFMGFYPGTAYVAIARRVDHEAGAESGVQFLFGTRQAF